MLLMIVVYDFFYLEGFILLIVVNKNYERTTYYATNELCSNALTSVVVPKSKKFPK